MRNEFTLLHDHGCVGDGLIGIHSTALTAADYAAWRAPGGGAVVWSPFSNLWLYGGTTDVLAARRRTARVPRVRLDSVGHAQRAGELKSRRRGTSSARRGVERRRLVEMATANPGDTLARAWGVQVGRLVPGALADVAVFTNVDGDPWRTVLARRPSATCGS